MWGDIWGEFLWGEPIAQVPSIGLFGLLILALAVMMIGVAAHRRDGSRWIIWTVSCVGVLIPFTIYAGTTILPHSFVNGTIADATEVNENFDALVFAIESPTSARKLACDSSGCVVSGSGEIAVCNGTTCGTLLVSGAVP